MYPIGGFVLKNHPAIKPPIPLEHNIKYSPIEVIVESYIVPNFLDFQAAASPDLCLPSWLWTTYPMMWFKNYQI